MRTFPAWAATGPVLPVAVGMIMTPDMALDHELRRWAPLDVSLLATRTPFTALPVSVAQAEHVGDAVALQRGVQDLAAVGPAAYAYACTSGSFVRGVLGEQLLVEAMRTAGAPTALTTSGALVRALTHLGVQRVGIATPYDPEVTHRLTSFLGECGIEVVASAHLGLTGAIWTVPYGTTAGLVGRADHRDAQAIVVSCTNLPTYDIIGPLEKALGKPVVTANQATMWAVLGEVGRRAVGTRQRLLTGRGVGSVARIPRNVPRRDAVPVAS